MEIRMIDYGSALSTRKVGKIIGDKARESILNKQYLVLDFFDVRLVTHSFSDEVVGKIVEESGIENFSKFVSIKNANQNVKAVISSNLASVVAS